jgi:hypothetical protein
MHSNLRLWLDHPLTKVYVKILREYRETQISAMLNMGSLTADKIGELAELKGQVKALDMMLNKDMLETLLEDEVIDD